MLMRVIVLIVMSWALSANSMQDDLQKKLNLRAVAKHLGFNSDTIRFDENKLKNEVFVLQTFEPGWISIRMNQSGQFKIASCAFDLGEIKNNYCQTDWLSLVQALAYEPDLQPFYIANDLLEYMKREEIKCAMSKRPN